MKKDKKVTFSIVAPESIKNEVDELIAKSNGILRSRSHAWSYIYQEWKELRQTSKKTSVQMYEVAQ